MAALLLALACAAPSSAESYNAFVIEDAGWEVAEPRGFTRVEKWGAGKDQEWSREWTETVRWSGEERRILHIEYIAVKYLSKFEIDLRAKRESSPAAFKVCRGNEPQGRQKSGRHQGRDTLSYACRSEAENLFPAVDRYHELVVRSGRGHADVIQLSYRHRTRVVDEDWQDLRGRYLLPRSKREPSLKIFRAMQESLRSLPK